jgi:hypothetical protein
VISDTQAEPEKTVLYVIEDVPLFYNTPAPKGSKARHAASATSATFATCLTHDNRMKVAQTVRHCGALHHSSSLDLRRVMSHVLRCSNPLSLQCPQYPARFPHARRYSIATPMASYHGVASSSRVSKFLHCRVLCRSGADLLHVSPLHLWKRCVGKDGGAAFAVRAPPRTTNDRNIDHPSWVGTEDCSRGGPIYAWDRHSKRTRAMCRSQHPPFSLFFLGFAHGDTMLELSLNA